MMLKLMKKGSLTLDGKEHPHSRIFLQILTSWELKIRIMPHKNENLKRYVECDLMGFSLENGVYSNSTIFQTLIFVYYAINYLDYFDTYFHSFNHHVLNNLKDNNNDILGHHLDAFMLFYPLLNMQCNLH